MSPAGGQLVSEFRKRRRLGAADELGRVSLQKGSAAAIVRSKSPASPSAELAGNHCGSKCLLASLLRDHHIFSMKDVSKSAPPRPKTTEGSPASSKTEIAAFVEAAARLTRPISGRQRGRLLFALDATMSRQPTWDLACTLQGEMFKSLPTDNALDVQLLYFRGMGECRASKWVSDTAGLARLMTGITCRGGNTQISKVLAHARAEHARQRLDAVVFVGDAIEENVDSLAEKAGQLRLLGCPLFIFQEGHDRNVQAAFKEFARLTKGAYARFDANAPDELAALLRAVAAYATGGRASLKLQQSSSATALLSQLT